MRKVLNYSLFFLLSFVFIISFAKADSCNYKEQAALNKEAKNIDYQYEFIKDDSINKYFKIYITNIPEDLRLEVTDDYSNQTKDIIYQETEDGLYTMNMYTSNKRTKYTINIYAISGSCSGSLLYKKTFTTPRYNPFSTSYICEEEPDYKYCNEFANTEKMTYEEFLEDAMQYHAGKSQTQKSTSMWQKILSFLNTYKWFFVGGIIIIGTGTLIIILKRRNSIKKRGI